jgi:LPS O-antigen subunit length determinant protein (WzzB/FepE family)
MIQTEKIDELSLAEIWMFLKHYKQVILLIPLVCAIASYILVAFFITPQWEATAIVQVGQVGQVTKPAEPIGNVIVRMLAPSFVTDFLNQSNLAPKDIESAKANFNRSWKVTKPRDVDLLEFKLRGNSPEVVRSLTYSSFDYLKRIHDKLMSANLDDLKSKFKTVNEEFNQVQEERDLFKKRLLAKHDSASSDTILAAIALNELSTEFRVLKDRKLLLTEQMGPSETFSTRLVGDISVTPVPTRKSMIVVLAILVGLFGGIFIAFVHSAITRSNA